MAVQKIMVPSIEEFERFVMLPENADQLFEYIGGDIVEVVSNGYSSELGALMVVQLGMFVLPRGLGRITGADGGYRIANERYMPDAAFISKEKQPEPFRGAWNPTPPDLAVEVLSPSNTDAEMRIKIVNYLRVGTVVWVINPDAQRVEVYVPEQFPRILTMDDMLNGGDVLPGFELAVKDIFADAE